MRNPACDCDTTTDVHALHCNVFVARKQPSFQSRPEIATAKVRHKFMKNEAVTLLINSLKDVNEEWVFNEYIATNRKKNISVWTSNVPVFNTNTYPTEMNLSLLDKWKIYKALKQARTNYWIRNLTIRKQHQKI